MPILSITLSSVPNSQLERAVLLDTSAILGLFNSTDQWHEKARHGFALLVEEKRPIYLTNLAIAEAHSLILLRLRESIAQAWLDSIKTNNIVYHEPQDHGAILGLLRRNQGRGFSYVDVFSFLVMERKGLRLAFTFDRHFQDYGWEIFPGPLT